MISRLIFGVIMPLPSTILLMRKNRKQRRAIETLMGYSTYLATMLDSSGVKLDEFDQIVIADMFKEYLKESA